MSKITDKGKLKKIKQITTRYMKSACPKCGSEEDWADKKDTWGHDICYCTKCGYEFLPNWHMNYIEEIEKIIKIK